MSTTPDSPARDAFFRHHDRLASVVMELAGAAPAAATQAVAEVMAGWLDGATPADAASWPQAFWSAVVWSPRLVLDQRPMLVGPLAPLAAMPVPVRMAVLLRLAGLDDATAAAVTRQPLETFRSTFQRGIPRTTTGSIDAERWQTWQQALRLHAASLAPERLLRLAAARSGQPLPEAPSPTPAAELPHDLARHRPVWHWVAGVGVLTLAALASTWVVERFRYSADGTPRIRTEALPPSGQPVRMAGGSGTVEQAGADAAIASDLAFLSWYTYRRSKDAPTMVVPLPDVPEAPAASETSESTDAL